MGAEDMADLLFVCGDSEDSEQTVNLLKTSVPGLSISISGTGERVALIRPLNSPSHKSLSSCAECLPPQPVLVQYFL